MAPTAGESADVVSCAGEGSDVVGWARSITEATTLAGDLFPHVILLDDELARGDTELEIAALRRASPGSSIFIVTDVRGVLELAHLHGEVAGFLNRERIGVRPSSSATG